MKNFMKIQYYVLIFLGFVIIGVSSAISGQVETGRWWTAGYYIDLISTYLAILFIISGVLLKAVMDFMERNKEYQEGTEDISKFAKETYRPLLFDKFSTVVNRRRKINQHKHNTLIELRDLDRLPIWVRLFDKQEVELLKKSQKLYATVITEDMSDEEIKQLAQAKATDEYCVKKDEIIKKLEPSWIEKNIDGLDISYDRINAAIILSGYYSKEENTSANDFITKDAKRRVVRDRGPLLLLSFGFSAFVGTIAIQLIFDASAFVSSLVKSIVLVYQMYLTHRYSLRFNEVVTLHDMRFRRGTVKEYENWVKGQVSEEQLKKEQQERLNKALKEKEEVEQDGIEEEHPGLVTPSS